MYLFIAAIMCGGSVRSILLLSLVARYLETIYVCIWRILYYIIIYYFKIHINMLYTSA